MPNFSSESLCAKGEDEIVLLYEWVHTSGKFGCEVSLCNIVSYFLFSEVGGEVFARKIASPQERKSRDRTMTDNAQDPGSIALISDDNSVEDGKWREGSEKMSSSSKTDDDITVSHREDVGLERAPFFRLGSELDIENQRKKDRSPTICTRGPTICTPIIKYRPRPKIVECSSSDGSSEGQTIRPSVRSRIPTLTPDEMKRIPRLVHRNLPFHQSKQSIAVKNEKALWHVNLHATLLQDWYHLILRWPTMLSILTLVSIW